jgi:hypothetical protein
VDRLAEYVEHCQRQTFCWQGWNCVHFAREWVLRYEGLLCAFPKEFTEQGVCTQIAAYRYARNLGGISAIVTSALGRDPVPAAFAAYGDLVFAGAAQSAGTLGICNGRTSFALSTSRWISLLETKTFDITWKLQCA